MNVAHCVRRKLSDLSDTRKGLVEVRIGSRFLNAGLRRASELMEEPKVFARGAEEDSRVVR